MSVLKCGVVVFPGSNCDDDLIHVLGEVCKLHVEKYGTKRIHYLTWMQSSCLVDFHMVIICVLVPLPGMPI